MKIKSKVKRIRKSYLFSAAVLVIVFLSPVLQALAINSFNEDILLLKSGMLSLDPAAEFLWRNELPVRILDAAEGLNIPENARIDGKKIHKGAFLMAQIWVESRFFPEARSRSNAQGLMQMKPSTAHLIAPQLNIEKKSTYYDVDENIRLGVTYMNDLLTEFKDLRRATLAYNIGPNGLKRGGKNEFYWTKIVKTYKLIVQ